jgi:hypothetical protein
MAHSNFNNLVESQWVGTGLKVVGALVVGKLAVKVSLPIFVM